MEGRQRSGEKTGEGLKRERKEAKFVKGWWCVGSRRWKEEREKKRRLFTIYRCRLRVAAKKAARRVLGKAVKPWPDNVKRFLACKRFLSLCSRRNYRCRFRLSGKLTGETTTRIRGAENENWKERNKDREGRRIGDEHGGRRWPTILSSRFKTHAALVSCAHKSCACLGRPG